MNNIKMAELLARINERSRLYMADVDVAMVYLDREQEGSVYWDDRVRRRAEDLVELIDLIPDGTDVPFT